MFSLPGRLASPALQRSGAFLHYVNDRCTELCDIIQSNVTRVYQEFSSPVKQKKAGGVKSNPTFKRKLSSFPAICLTQKRVSVCNKGIRVEYSLRERNEHIITTRHFCRSLRPLFFFLSTLIDTVFLQNVYNK